ncbi:uncharacterized protein ASCRUDRAFT_76406 [Ascoidea rubescens DSM 1968]|uniref:L domain-like protein n=1 Tax=Ascoidea rubescens DSM 1968 TaxID=1344418 RepID=A0A1D2VFK9_9ASCO|nr:hypothetical protein ASCRUDRAFT_76406 [Ascoidea rubescens DSM 1968]ODV60415.1 hypothetical protein ASCRUDRAFT_76406 [Ascoidea rubescens DSM 1968]
MENETNLKNLSEVNLSNNNISKMDNLRCLSNLNSLDLSNNSIEILVPLIQLNSCSHINLNSNNITRIEVESIVHKFYSMFKRIGRKQSTFPVQNNAEMILNLSSNPLKQLNGISKWSDLAHLILPDNISRINKRNLAQLPKMKEIECSKMILFNIKKLKKKYPDIKIKFFEEHPLKTCRNHFI